MASSSVWTPTFMVRLANQDRSTSVAIASTPDDGVVEVLVFRYGLKVKGMTVTINRLIEMLEKEHS